VGGGDVEMRIVPIAMAAFALIYGFDAPARASDFSKLGEPSFARSMLISAERRIELSCATLAYLPYRKIEADILDEMLIGEVGLEDTGSKQKPMPKIAFEKLLTEPQAETLKAQTLLRVASDVGDRAIADQMFEGYYSKYIADWDPTEEAIAKMALKRENAKEKCSDIFNAARTDQLETMLSPASAKPIALIDLETCLAYDLIARDASNYSELQVFRGDDDEIYTKLVGPKGPKRKARKKEIAAHALTLGTIKPEYAAAMQIPCLATYVSEFKKLMPDTKF
jgi:hypothetical protein